RRQSIPRRPLLVEGEFLPGRRGGRRSRPREVLGGAPRQEEIPYAEEVAVQTPGVFAAGEARLGREERGDHLGGRPALGDRRGEAGDGALAVHLGACLHEQRIEDVDSLVDAVEFPRAAFLLPLAAFSAHRCFPGHCRRTPPSRSRDPMSSPFFLYLHGFASGPASEKARFFSARLAERGVDLAVPDLNEGEGGFFGLTVSRALRQVEEVLAQSGARERGAVVLGSSLGGYLGALAASRNPEIQAVVMMAPAFDLPARWQHILGDEVISRWRSEGKLEVDHYAWKRKEAISFAFYRDSLGHPPYPKVECPGLILDAI